MKRKQQQAQILQKIEENRKNITAREFFIEVSGIKAGYQERTENFVQKDVGELISKDKDILKPRKEYFHQVLNDRCGIKHTAEIEDQQPIHDEVNHSIRK